MGLNITNANYVVLLEPFRFDAKEAQASMRVHRIGQTRPVEVIKFFTRNTIDERLLRLRRKKGDLDATDDGDSTFAESELDILFGRTASD